MNSFGIREFNLDPRYQIDSKSSDWIQAFGLIPRVQIYWERWRDTAAPRSFLRLGSSVGVLGSLHFLRLGPASQASLACYRGRGVDGCEWRIEWLRLLGCKWVAKVHLLSVIWLESLLARPCGMRSSFERDGKCLRMSRRPILRHLELIVSLTVP